MKLQNYVTGKWITGDGDCQQLFNAVTGDPIATTRTKGHDFAALADYARKVGHRAVRKLHLNERAN